MKTTCFKLYLYITIIENINIHIILNSIDYLPRVMKGKFRKEEKDFLTYK